MNTTEQIFSAYVELLGRNLEIGAGFLDGASRLGQECLAVQLGLGQRLRDYNGELVDAWCKQAEMFQLGLPLDTSFFLSPTLEPISNLLFPSAPAALVGNGLHQPH